MLYRVATRLGVVLVIAAFSRPHLSALQAGGLAASAPLVVMLARVYSTGISNGGIVSYTLVCNTSIFAAIGLDSATQLNASGRRIRRR